MAERVGFEPTVPVRYDGFQDRSVMTTSVSLRLSAYKYYHIKNKKSISFLKNNFYWQYIFRYQFYYFT